MLILVSKIQPGPIQLFSNSRITNIVKFSLHKDFNTLFFQIIALHNCNTYTV